MTSDDSFFQLILDASFVVQAVLLLLVVVSLASWTFIFSKRQELQSAEMIADAFENRFWSGIDLAELYKQLTADRHQAAGMENLFIAAGLNSIGIQLIPDAPVGYTYVECIDSHGIPGQPIRF